MAKETIEQQVSDLINKSNDQYWIETTGKSNPDEDGSAEQAVNDKLHAKLVNDIAALLKDE